MLKMQPEDIILRPIITEKSSSDIQEGKYTFLAARDDLGKVFCYLRWKIIFRVEKTCLKG